MLAGCAGPAAPYVIPPGKLARGGQSVDLTVCYNGLTTNLDAIAARVADDCLAHHLLYDEFNLDVCSLAFPRRAVYRCEGISSRLATERPQMNLEQLR